MAMWMGVKSQRRRRSSSDASEDNVTEIRLHVLGNAKHMEIIAEDIEAV